MACYHFTMKLDRKPDKTPVGASVHLDYINRDGKFKDIDLKRELAEQTYSGQMLCPPMTQDTESVSTLYRSIYGSILHNGIGVELSDKASRETIQIALVLAQKKYGNTLDIRGNADFKGRILTAARDMALPITFTDPMLNTCYAKLQKEADDGRRRENSQRRSDGSRRGRRPGKPVLFAAAEQTGSKEITETRDRLHVLSQRSLDGQPGDAGMLLSHNDAIRLEYGKAHRINGLRRNVCELTRAHAENIADEILHRSQGAVLAASHANYINRRENFAAKGGCIFKAHHLPSWAQDSPKAFFEAADTYERVNGIRYREIEFALPNELPLPEQKRLIREFISHHLQDQYYAYAIHDKIGAMSNGEHNTHVHIMFSDRRIDDLEREQERFPELFFHRANKNHPERGGCPKDERFNGKDRNLYLAAMREDFADIQNRILQENHIDAQVDHRSLRAQYLDALAQGNTELARELNRLPEPHIGPEAAANKKSQKVVDLLAYRAYKLEKSRLIYQANKLENANAQEIAQAENDNLESAVLDTGQQKHIQEPRAILLKKQVDVSLQHLRALSNLIDWQPQAEEKAKLQLMTTEERAALHRMQELEKQREELMKLRLQLDDSGTDTSPLIAQNHQELCQKIEQDLHHIDRDIASSRSILSLAEERLATPQVEQKMQKLVTDILAVSHQHRKHLEEEQQKLHSLVDELRTAVNEELEKDAEQTITDPDAPLRFSAREIEDYLRYASFQLNKDVKSQQQQLEQIGQQRISFERATAIAQNIFVKGAFKQLRQKRQQLKKENDRLAAAQKELQQEKELLSSMPKPKWYQNKDSYKAQQAKVSNLDQAYQERIAAFQQQSSALDQEENRLIAACSTPQAQQRIAAITQGILAKNQPCVTKYNQLNEQILKTQQRLTHITTLQKAVHQQALKDSTQGILYQVEPPSTDTMARPNQPRASQNHAKLAAAESIGTHQPISSGGSVVIRLSAQDEELDFDVLDQTERDNEIEKSMHHQF